MANKPQNPRQRPGQGQGGQGTQNPGRGAGQGSQSPGRGGQEKTGGQQTGGRGGQRDDSQVRQPMRPEDEEL